MKNTIFTIFATLFSFVCIAQNPWDGNPAWDNKWYQVTDNGSIFDGISGQINLFQSDNKQVKYKTGGQTLYVVTDKIFDGEYSRYSSTPIVQGYAVLHNGNEMKTIKVVFHLVGSSYQCAQTWDKRIVKHLQKGEVTIILPHYNDEDFRIDLPKR